MEEGIKKLSTEVDQTIQEAMEPSIEAWMSKIQESLDFEHHKPGALTPNREKEKTEIEEARKNIAKWLTAEEERKLLVEAFSVIKEDKELVQGGQLLQKELETVGEKLLNSMDQETQEDQLSVYETMQEWLGISDQSLQSMYELGCLLLEKDEMKKAMAVFVLLTHLNTFIFEPWLALGICYRRDENLFAALHAFSMASLINLKHPVPHLNSAEIYLLAGENELAKETVNYCLSLISPEHEEGYALMIEEIQRRI